MSGLTQWTTQNLCVTAGKPSHCGSIAALSTCAVEAAACRKVFETLSVTREEFCMTLESFFPCCHVSLCTFHQAVARQNLHENPWDLEPEPTYVLQEKGLQRLQSMFSFKFMFQRNNKTPDLFSSHIHSYIRVLTWAELCASCFELRALTFTILQIFLTGYLLSDVFSCFGISASGKMFLLNIVTRFKFLFLILSTHHIGNKGVTTMILLFSKYRL